MKNTMILIALALLLIVPVFADGNATVVAANETTKNTLIVKGVATGTTLDAKTDVKITLNLYPKYVFSVTKEADKYIKANITIDPYETSKTYYENLKHEDEILMTNDEVKFEVKPPTDTYYVSYWFWEYNEKVTLTVAIDDDMELQDKGEGTTYIEGKDKIRYQAKLTADTDAEAKTGDVYTIFSNPTVDSSGGSKSVVIASVTAPTTQLASCYCGNFKLELSAVDADKSTAGKYQGTYLSHITLTLASNS